MEPGLALGRRQMLLKGSAHNLARFIPLFDFAPLLYREHLAQASENAKAEVDAQANENARFDVNPQVKGYAEVAMNDSEYHGSPIPLTRLSPVEKVADVSIRGLAYLMGYGIGLMRYRIMKKLSLFDVLASLSQGVEAAAPDDDYE